jgi:hypothetical protein
MNQDDQIRLAASDWLNEQTLIYGEALPRRLLEQGFYFQEQRITLMGPQGHLEATGDGFAHFHYNGTRRTL